MIDTRCADAYAFHARLTRSGDQDEYGITRDQRRHERCKVAMLRVTENPL